MSGLHEGGAEKSTLPHRRKRRRPLPLSAQIPDNTPNGEPDGDLSLKTETLYSESDAPQSTKLQISTRAHEQNVQVEKLAKGDRAQLLSLETSLPGPSKTYTVVVKKLITRSDLRDGRICFSQSQLSNLQKCFGGAHQTEDRSFKATDTRGTSWDFILRTYRSNNGKSRSGAVVGLASYMQKFHLAVGTELSLLRRNDGAEIYRIDHQAARTETPLASGAVIAVRGNIAVHDDAPRAASSDGGDGEEAACAALQPLISTDHTVPVEQNGSNWPSPLPANRFIIAAKVLQDAEIRKSRLFFPVSGLVAHFSLQKGGPSIHLEALDAWGTKWHLSAWYTHCSHCKFDGFAAYIRHFGLQAGDVLALSQDGETLLVEHNTATARRVANEQRCKKLASLETGEKFTGTETRYNQRQNKLPLLLDAAGRTRQAKVALGLEDSMSDERGPWAEHNDTDIDGVAIGHENDDVLMHGEPHSPVHSKDNDAGCDEGTANDKSQIGPRYASEALLTDCREVEILALQSRVAALQREVQEEGKARKRLEARVDVLLKEVKFLKAAEIRAAELAEQLALLTAARQ
jgi:hypothetical protein